MYCTGVSTRTSVTIFSGVFGWPLRDAVKVAGMDGVMSWVNSTLESDKKTRKPG